MSMLSLRVQQEARDAFNFLLTDMFIKQSGDSRAAAVRGLTHKTDTGMLDGWIRRGTERQTLRLFMRQGRGVKKQTWLKKESCCLYIPHTSLNKAVHNEKSSNSGICFKALRWSLCPAVMLPAKSMALKIRQIGTESELNGSNKDLTGGRIQILSPSPCRKLLQNSFTDRLQHPTCTKCAITDPSTQQL